MGDSEKNEAALPIRDPEFKLEITAATGPTKFGQRIHGFGQAGGGRGTGIEPSLSTSA